MYSYRAYQKYLNSVLRYVKSSDASEMRDLLLEVESNVFVVVSLVLVEVLLEGKKNSMKVISDIIHQMSNSCPLKNEVPELIPVIERGWARGMREFKESNLMALAGVFAGSAPPLEYRSAAEKIEDKCELILHEFNKGRPSRI